MFTVPKSSAFRKHLFPSSNDGIGWKYEPSFKFLETFMINKSIMVLKEARIASAVGP